MVDRHLLRVQNGNGLVKLGRVNVKCEVIGAGELLGGIAVGWGQIRFTKQIQNRAIGQVEVGDFACGDCGFEGGGHFIADEFVESENLAVELARSGHVLDIEGDVVDSPEGVGGKNGGITHGGGDGWVDFPIVSGG